ncbi:MAG: methylated-DNA--[Bacteroidales bacterium]|nr:methylated-DNA--[protein]-cysteine S-methyltransferase [Prevotella sp.]MBR4349383.1 methylated-DNA--[protein]-cysteine S-methyltransferase [Bacteroidales bacterium]
MDFITHYCSPIGRMRLASDGEALSGLWFEGQRYFSETLSRKYEERSDLAIFNATRAWLDAYFSGKKPDFTPQLLLRTSDFRKKVWTMLLGIPFGQTTTYGAIAQQIARARGLSSMPARAVGRAIGHNSIALIVPCHRVVGSGGRLTGYAGGIDRKQWLLQLEKMEIGTNQ